ncbi:hypothetical protein EKH77_16645 [Streptomyces luteoverticillatus]|uniref:Uncharacterized protein n=1 Tax=Streptomyces luteoverticillatus TaxID=66425 RepID=A0A3Q9FXI6_STRLT|nr:hypothetical protein [Streptomyces luteoverticillatus]AZQ72629.1 hypothetical protein EKH77_16645 [Streptomyces luteoverticillatus]
MAANPQQNPGGEYDPAGSTQMFRAFVADEGGPAATPGAAPVVGAPVGGRAARRAAASSSGPSAGLIIGVIVAIVLVAGAAWLALG